MNTSLACCTSVELTPQERQRVEALAARHRAEDAGFARWAAGYGVIEHDALTQVGVHEMVTQLVADGTLAETAMGYRRLIVAGAAANVLAMPVSALLDADEVAAIEGRGDPTRLWRQAT